LLYGANKPLTSGPGLFGADALGTSSMATKTGGGMFDDDEEDNFMSNIKNPA
jgi:hypothetical protein